MQNIELLRASPTVWYITCHPSKFGKTSKNQSPTVCQSDLPKFSGCLPRCRARIFAHANPTAYPSSRVRDSSSRAVEEFSSPSRVTEARLLLYFFPPPSSRYLRQHRPPSSRVLSTTRRSRGLVPWSFSRTGSSPAGLTLPDLIPASTSTDLVLAIDVHRWWFV